MRKILMGTTAVVGAALLSSGAFAQGTTAGTGSLAPGQGQGQSLTAAPAPSIAGAGGLSVRLGGFFEFSGAMIQDDGDRARRFGARNTEARSRYDFRNDMELQVFIDGRAANGMQYGAVLEFQSDNVGTNGSTVNFDEMYGFIRPQGIGTFYFGQEDSAASLLIVRAPAAGALGGDAVWDEFIDQTGFFDGSPYIASGINDGNDATKIGYLSPQFAGFDFGVSFAPNANEGEFGTEQRNRNTIENEISAAIRYRGTFGPVGFQAMVGGMWADAPRNITNTAVFSGTERNRPQDVNAYFVGAQIAAYGFAFGGEYARGSYGGASVGRRALNDGLEDSWHYLIGATYTLGPVVFGAVYGQGEQDNGTNAAGVAIADRKHTVWGLGAVYNLAPGLGLYVAYNNIQDENVPLTAPSNARFGGAGTTTFSQNGSTTRTINIGMAGIRLAF
ncbi:porin [Neoroseomonas rubea]|uniref:porin n=1 Tax=Neoroseomonas rubea TaxID=2748666 RepID=UPI0018E0542B|nr:porin [Roseomonas rubea]